VSQRERMMVLVLGVLLLGGLGFAGYTLLAKPILDKQKNLRAATAQVDEMEADRDTVMVRNQRLTQLYQRSLPGGDVQFAKQEYDAILLQLLQESNAPRGFNLEFDQGKSANTTGIPMLNPEVRQDKTTTYQRLVFKIGLKQASLSMVMDFLKRYYRLNLLHQITLLEIKRDQGVSLNKDERNVNERNDLTVNITTEAIILNGTPARKTLLAIPDANGAVLGGAGLFDMKETPSNGREVMPTQYEQIIAKFNNQERDYKVIAAKDPFHGTLPVPPPPEEKKAAPIIVAPPKPDFSGSIWYSSLFRTTAGDEHKATVFIRDIANNEDYTLELTQSGERLKVVVEKYEFNSHKIDPTKRKERMYRQDTLEISKYTMRTKHLFTVYGLDGDALIVGEKPTGLSAASKADEPRGPNGARTTPGRGGPSSPRPVLPLDPKAAVVGGLVVTAPQKERIYRWENGKKLSEIMELKGTEAEKAVQRAQSSLLDRAVNATAPPAPLAASSDGK
jgi:hypothetical protein